MHQSPLLASFEELDYQHGRKCVLNFSAFGVVHSVVSLNCTVSGNTGTAHMDVHCPVVLLWWLGCKGIDFKP